MTCTDARTARKREGHAIALLRAPDKAPRRRPFRLRSIIAAPPMSRAILPLPTSVASDGASAVARARHPPRLRFSRSLPGDLADDAPSIT
jgi:hypothetical protein